MTDSFAKSRYHRIYVVAYNELYKIVLMALCMRIQHTYELYRAYRPMFTDFTWCIIVKNKTEFHFYLISAMWNGVVLSICENVMMTKDLTHAHTCTHPCAQQHQPTKRKKYERLVGAQAKRTINFFQSFFLWICVFFYLFIYYMFLLCCKSFDVRMARWCIVWYVEWGLGINNRSAHICALYFQFSIFLNGFCYVRVRMWYLNDANVNEAINEISPERNAKLQNKPPPTLPRVVKGQANESGTGQHSKNDAKKCGS